MEARAKIEEDLFTRVPLSKTERRRAKATSRSMNSLANVGDFGDDVADLVEVAEALEKSGGAAAGKRAGRLVDSVSLASGVEVKQKQKPVSGEQDVPQRDSLGVRGFSVPLGVPFLSLLLLYTLCILPSPRIIRSVDDFARGHSASKMVQHEQTRFGLFPDRGEFGGRRVYGRRRRSRQIS